MLASFPNGRGAVCFDFGMQPPVLSPPELLSSGLAWFWTILDLRETGSLTRLGTGNAQSFLDALRGDCNGDGPEIAILGVAPESEQVLLVKSDLANALHNFAKESLGPIQIIIYQEDDGDVVAYATWPLSDAVRNLIASWFIRTDNIRSVRRKDWKKWQTKLLEALIGNIISRNNS